MTDPEDILELDEKPVDKPEEEITQQYLVIGGEEESELIETPFYALPPSSALIPQSSETRIIEALDNLFTAIVGLEERALTGQVKNIDLAIGNDSVTVRLSKVPGRPLAVSIMTVGFYQ